MKTQKGFTLIETLIAVFILTLTVGALLRLTAAGFYSVRYARNQMVANSLLQESLEYVRNSRDTASVSGVSWESWKAGLSTNENGTPTGDTNQGCFSGTGCTVDPYATVGNVKGCNGTCRAISFFSSTGLYGYVNSVYPPVFAQGAASATETSYIRTIKVYAGSADQLTVSASVTWLNGAARKTITQSVLLTRWR